MRNAPPAPHGRATTTNPTLLLGLAVSAGIAMACGSDGDKGPRPAFAECVDTTDCEVGLTCIKAGPVANHCSSMCSLDTDCTAMFGAGYLCSDRNACTPICGFLSDEGCTSTNTTFASCGDGLSCRGFNADRCVSLCAVPEWGTQVRTPGLAPSPAQDAGTDASVQDAATKR